MHSFASGPLAIPPSAGEPTPRGSGSGRTGARAPRLGYRPVTVRRMSPTRSGAGAILIAFGLLLALAAPSSAAAETPMVAPPETVVPSAGLPPEVVDNRSNNNVHVIRHRGRYYMV